MSTLTYGELFAGIGGMSRGLERAGMTPRWFVEIDPFCRRVLARHWPHVAQYGDIKELTGDELEPVDLICGGFPCQPVSLAGKRLGQDDDRWLWPEFVRIVRMVRPRFVLVENVPGLLVRGLGDVLGDLAESGYDAEWDCIPAAAVGAPHLRNRVYLVAYARCVGLQRWGESGDVAGASGATESEAHERQRGRDATGNSRAIGTGVNALADTDGKRELQPTRSLEQVGRWISDRCWRGAESDVGGTPDGVSAGLHGPGDVNDSQASNSEETSAEGVSASAVVRGMREGREGNAASPEPTRAACGEDALLFVPCESGPGTRQGAQASDEGLHSLQPRIFGVHPHQGQNVQPEVSFGDRTGERGQAMGFWSGDWERGIPRVAHGVPNRVDRLRALGNAVVPQVTEYIGRCIMEAAS